MPRLETASSLPDDVVTAVRAMAGGAREHDGIEALGEQTLLWLTDPHAPVTHVVAWGAPPPGQVEAADAVVGYAQVDLGGPTTTPASAELVVAPEQRRRGVGRALLDAATAVARDAGGRDVVVWAHGDLPGARGLARSAGLGITRELWQMARPLTVADAEGDPPTPPEGVTIRPFVVGRDEDAWVAVNARAFASHPEQGRLTRADLEAREREPWFDAADLLLAERDGRLVASVWMKVEPGASAGELYALGVDPDEQGTGLGRFLTGLVVRHLAAQGLARAELYVEGDNEPAVRTYARAGFTQSRLDVQYGADPHGSAPGAAAHASSGS
ncbi:mycothiol synthase [Actinotalea sp. Marseille-Q4924]|uniref:mycothiol synthase n=1 Tax=Actinotalea sp. Marseille-Q4924 TaxID=2866571 RepID=UPI001CE454AD|nr:mycothiol synthase [Actinotalea sp. Marseille-Q4924]